MAYVSGIRMWLIECSVPLHGLCTFIARSVILEDLWCDVMHRVTFACEVILWHVARIHISLVRSPHFPSERKSEWK